MKVVGYKYFLGISIVSLFSVAFAEDSCCGKVASHTFFAVRPQFHVGSPEYTSSVRRLYNTIDESNKIAAAGNNQKLILFIRGNAISGAPIIIGICQLARPVNAGITTPNNMIKPCIVVI